MFKRFFVSASLLALPLAAQELVSDGGFENKNNEYGAVPNYWKAAPKTWHWINDDGVSNATSIQLKLTGRTSATAERNIACKGDTAYILSASFKSEGAFPLIKIIDERGKQIAILKADRDSDLTWKDYSVEFRTAEKSKKLTVIIGAEGSKGVAKVDDVSIMPAHSKRKKKVDKLFIPPAGTVNLALHRPYTMSLVTNYNRCKDKDDKIQLTDGKYTHGTLWLQKSTVGWRFKEKVNIIIDLGKVQPITGFSYSTAAGSSGVSWAKAVYVYTSDNKKDWYYIGDLWQKSMSEIGRPDEKRYNKYRAASMNMPCRGRWVCFQTRFPSFHFVDEIEVFKGDDKLLSGVMPGKKVISVDVFYNSLLLAEHFRKDADSILKAATILPAAQQKALAKELDMILADPRKFVREDDKKFIPLLPLHSAHEEVFAKNNTVLAAYGYTKPIFWQNCRWDNLSPIAIPPKNSIPDVIKVDMMANEVRAETVNILNPTDKVLVYKVSVEGLPAKANIDCREVLFMDTRQGEYVASALKPGNGSSITVKVHPGTSRQIWFSFVKPQLEAGVYKATIKAVAENAPQLKVPLELAISKVKFPARPRLHVGGWDYLDTNCNYYRAAGNLKPHLELLKDLYMDAPWGNPGVLPKGAIFDKDGHLTNPDSLDYSNWKKWMARFPDARIYCIAMRSKRVFYKEPMGTERFNNMVSEYMDAFAKYLRTTSVKPERVVLHLVDEPRAPSYDEVFIAWEKAINRNDPGFIFNVNPIYHNPEKASKEMLDKSDILCPDTIEMIIGGDKYRDFYWNRTRNTKKTLWLYSCSGPSRLLDPVYYHRVQKWHCFIMNAKGSFYWAFGCGGGRGDSWHAYSQPSLEYSPYYVSPTDVMHSKQSEGIREGVQDHEYLSMLKDRVIELKKAGKRSKYIDEAERLLVEGPKSVIAHYLKFPEGEARYWWGKNVVIRWKTDHDRTLMDKIRIQALRLLEKLQ